MKDNLGCSYCSEEFGDGQIVLAGNEFDRFYHHRISESFSISSAITCFRKQMVEDDPISVGVQGVHYRGALYPVNLLNGIAQTTALEMQVHDNGSSFVLGELSGLLEHPPLAPGV
tara:strand:+ start:301 stop:645 length:345 start_codon:yes stop_codon:yes gene_type:complete